MSTEIDRSIVYSNTYTVLHVVRPTFLALGTREFGAIINSLLRTLYEILNILCYVLARKNQDR